MSHALPEPVDWQGQRWTVTNFCIEALDRLYHVSAADIWPEEVEPPQRAGDLRSRYGIGAADFDAALASARAVFPRLGAPL